MMQKNFFTQLFSCVFISIALQGAHYGEIPMILVTSGEMEIVDDTLHESAPLVAYLEDFVSDQQKLTMWRNDRAEKKPDLGEQVFEVIFNQLITDEIQEICTNYTHGFTHYNHVFNEISTVLAFNRATLLDATPKLIRELMITISRLPAPIKTEIHGLIITIRNEKYQVKNHHHHHQTYFR